LERSALAILLVLSACSGADHTAPRPFVGSPPVDPRGRDSTPVASSPPGLHGFITDDDRRPVANAAIVIGTFFSATPSILSDSSGAYSLPDYRLSNCLDPAAYVIAEKDGYERDSRCVMKSPQDFHLYRIRRITAGDSTSL